MQRPKMFLNQSDQTAVNVSDIQDLIQFSCLGLVSSVQPTWCKLLRVGKLRKVAVVIVGGVNEKWYRQCSHLFTNIQQLFNVSVKVKPVSTKSVIHNLLFLKWTRSRLKKEVYISRLLEKEPDIPKQEEDSSSDDDNEEEECKLMRGDLVLTEGQMRWHGYLLPDVSPDFIQTNHVDAVDEDSPLIAIDCEMCLTCNGQELTRVSVVNEKHEVLYDTLVKPYNKIIHYNTQFSGITERLLNPVTIRLADVQKKLLSIIPTNAILVGQSLNGDLKALKMYHPHCIDTSSLFTTYKVGLKALTKFYLKKDIQCGNDGHNSIEDATASMDLALLKLRKGNNLRNYQSGRKNDLPVESIFQRIAAGKQKSTVLDVPGNLKKFYKDSVDCITVMTDSETKKKMKKALNGDSSLVCGHLHSFKTLMDGISHEQEVIESTLGKIDERVGEIYAAMPNNSLCIVVFASSTQDIDMDVNTSESELYSRCFAGIKYEKDEPETT
ncbi:RNA exonuclease 5-like isoform X2 [Antedon mediterranea]